jgi:DNA polymerase-1
MILQVHDELVFDVHPDELDAMTRLVHDEMRDAFVLRVPLGVEVKVGPNWDQVKPVAIA